MLLDTKLDETAAFIRKHISNQGGLNGLERRRLEEIAGVLNAEARIQRQLPYSQEEPLKDHSALVHAVPTAHLASRSTSR